MSILLRKAAALALGSTVAGGILAAFAWWKGVDLTQVDPTVLFKQHAVQEELPAAEGFRQAILEELATASVPAWTGNYIDSNGFETRQLVLGPQRFFYEYSHCTGTGELAYGKVESVDGTHVRLAPDFHVRPNSPREQEPDRRSAFWFESELYVVRWNEEQFLVPASRMPEFCRLAKAEKWDAMRYADYPRLRIGEGWSSFWDANFEGLPEVPAEFRHLLPPE